MVDVTEQGNKIVFRIKGLHKLFAFKNRIEVPRENIRSARRDPSVAGGIWKGWRCPGTHVPGLIVAGTFYSRGKRTFWDVSNADGTVVVELNESSYSQLVIEVENPDEVVSLLSTSD